MLKQTTTFRFAFRASPEPLDKVVVSYYLGGEEIPADALFSSFQLKPYSSEYSYYDELVLTYDPPKHLHYKVQVFRQNRISTETPIRKYTSPKASIDHALLSDVERPELAGEGFTIRFKISYLTYYGQNLLVVGSLPEMGCWDIKRALKLSHAGTMPITSESHGIFSDTKFNWQGDLHLPYAPLVISYRYVVVADGTDPNIEPGSIRTLRFQDNGLGSIVEFNDIWRWAEPAPNIFAKTIDQNLGVQSSFMKILPEIPTKAEKGKVAIIFNAHCAAVGQARVLRVVGSLTDLGSWNPSRGINLDPSTDLQWSVTFTTPRSSIPFEFKFVAIGGSDAIAWETHENRRATISDCCNVTLIDSWHLTFANLSSHCAGFLVNLNGISCESLVPTYSSLKKIADWGYECGFAAMHLISFLDTTAMYDCQNAIPVSGFALNPLFLQVNSDECPLDPSCTPAETLKRKLDYIRKVTKDKPDYCKTLAKTFREGNSEWLDPYIKLCAAARTTNDISKIDSLPEEVDEEFAEFVAFTQSLLFFELGDALKYTRDKNIAVCLDLPYAVSDHSVEAFTRPQLFMKDFALGEAPSAKHPLGIRYSAYPYQPSEITNYFKERLLYFSKLALMIRLESTMNFFRQWIIPRKTAIHGVFGTYTPLTTISYAELETWGLWDTERYTLPYITIELLKQLFNEDYSIIAENFLTRHPDGTYSFLPQYQNEVLLFNAELPPEIAAIRSKYADDLSILMSEFLLSEVSKNEFQPRPQIEESPGKYKSFSFKQLPPYEQTTFSRLHDEFLISKQRGLWTSNGRVQLKPLMSVAPSLILLSDAAGEEGECIEDTIQSLGILPLRAQIEGRTGNQFDDIRGYPYVSVACPQRINNVPLRELWCDGEFGVRKLWDDEFWEQGDPPQTFTDIVAVNIMNQHCWSSSMWAFIPMESLVKAGLYLVDGEWAKRFGYKVLDIDGYTADAEAKSTIAQLLAESKRR